jgi:hypothetical protein
MKAVKDRVLHETICHVKRPSFSILFTCLKAKFRISKGHFLTYAAAMGSKLYVSMEINSGLMEPSTDNVPNVNVNEKKNI